MPLDFLARFRRKDTPRTKAPLQAERWTVLDPDNVKLHARISALEYFTAEAFRMIYEMLGVSLEQIEASHQRLKEHLRTMKIPGADPAISDMAASEIEEAHTRLLGMIMLAAKQRMEKR
jgi:hypothetical protein